MFSLDTYSFLIALAASAGLDFYLCLLVHLRYGGQFGYGFFLPMGVVFSLPSLAALGLPLYLILIAPAQPALRAVLIFTLAFILVRILMRLTRRLLSKRFMAPAKTQTQAEAQTKV